MTGVLLIVSNIFFLVLFSSLFAAEGDRNRFFNPYILWTERITGPIGRFASDIVPGTSARVAAGVALLFLLAFRGALLNHAGDQQAILIGSTVSYLPRAGGAGAIVFSALHFATFLFHFWGFALLCAALSSPGDARTRISQALDAFAAPLPSSPMWARCLVVAAANIALVLLLRHFAVAVLPGTRTGFDAIFRADTPARLAAAYAGLVLLSVADVLNFAREALLLAIFASLFAAILQNRATAMFFMEFQNLILGRFSRHPVGIGILDFTPIIFFVALNFAYAVSVAAVTFALRRFGVIAAGALAAQPY